jgi:hypothetical protein
LVKRGDARIVDRNEVVDRALRLLDRERALVGAVAVTELALPQLRVSIAAKREQVCLFVAALAMIHQTMVLQIAGCAAGGAEGEPHDAPPDWKP